MNNDIVDELRTHLLPDMLSDHSELFERAADEIERLQALVEHLSSQLRLQIKANDKAWEAYKEVEGGA